MLYPGTQGGDPDVVRAEAQQNVDRMNANQKELKLLLGGAPDTRLMSLARDNPFDDPDTSRLVLIYIVVITILLLVPAINLEAVSHFRVCAGGWKRSVCDVLSVPLVENFSGRCSPRIWLLH